MQWCLVDKVMKFHGCGVKIERVMNVHMKEGVIFSPLVIGDGWWKKQKKSYITAHLKVESFWWWWHSNSIVHLHFANIFIYITFFSLTIFFSVCMCVFVCICVCMCLCVCIYVCVCVCVCAVSSVPAVPGLRVAVAAAVPITPGDDRDVLDNAVWYTAARHHRHFPFWLCLAATAVLPWGPQAGHHLSAFSLGLAPAVLRGGHTSLQQPALLSQHHARPRGCDHQCPRVAQTSREESFGQQLCSHADWIPQHHHKAERLVQETEQRGANTGQLDSSSAAAVVAVLPALVCSRSDPQGGAASKLLAAVFAGGGGGLSQLQAEDPGGAEGWRGPAAGPLPQAMFRTGVLSWESLASQWHSGDLVVSLCCSRHGSDAA